MSPRPPIAQRRPHPLVTHGDERVDPWHWLRSDDRSDPQVLELLEAENDYVKRGLAHTEGLQAELFAEMKARIKETDLSVPYRKRGEWFYARTEEGLQYPILCRTRVEPPTDASTGTAVPGEEVLLGLNALAGDSDYVALGAFDLAPDHHRFLYSTDHDGSERYTMRIRDLISGTDLDDLIPETTYGSAWAGDDTFFYVRPDEAMRPYQVWRHHVGSEVGSDELVFEEPDERFYVSVELSLSEDWVHITSESKVTSEELLVSAHEPSRAPIVAQPREQGVEYELVHAPHPVHGDRFLVLTNADGALNFKLMAAPTAAPGRENWQELVAHRPDVKLEGVTAFAGHLVRHERRGGFRRLVVVSYEDDRERELEMPEPVYDTGLSTNAEFQTRTLRFVYTSLVTPATVFEEDLDSAERSLLKTTEVLGGHDPADYETGRLWATAEDGTRVPISYVHRVGIAHDGSAPCLLYGYGSYEASMDPSFSILRLSLLDRGFVFAIAHVRGGGEMGRAWYDDGKLLNKQNTFNDFIACAEHAVAAGLASPDRIVARGGSAGGLLMGAVANMRPELFAAIVAEVPFVDCLTTILDDSLPLTVTEWEEWGNPKDDPAAYDYIKTYSPYDNVDAKPYPAVLATGGLNDPRVSYWEPAKWVQKLRASSSSDRVAYLKTEMGAGHQGPSGRYDAWKDEAFVLAFILDALDLAPKTA